MINLDEEIKKIMYIGYKGDQNTPFEAHGISFEKGVVYPVSKDVWEWARFQRSFVEVRKTSNRMLDWFREGSLGSINDTTEIHSIMSQM